MPRILIIDDEPDICKLLSSFLQRNGYDAAYSFNGRAGLELLSSQKADLVLCDYRLGDMDGSEVLQKIREDHPEIPVIIFTAYSDIKTAVRVMKMGADNYITKPIDTEELLRILEKTFNEIALRQTQESNRKTADIRQVSLEAEQAFIMNVLKKVNYNRSEAARILKIDRKTLYNKLRGLEVKKV
jgi:two-component system response regulator HydG